MTYTTTVFVEGEPCVHHGRYASALDAVQHAVFKALAETGCLEEGPFDVDVVHHGEEVFGGTVEVRLNIILDRATYRRNGQPCRCGDGSCMLCDDEGFVPAGTRTST